MIFRITVECFRLWWHESATEMREKMIFLVRFFDLMMCSLLVEIWVCEDRRIYAIE
jgi:hypothetical protein